MMEQLINKEIGKLNKKISLIDAITITIIWMLIGIITPLWTSLGIIGITIITIIIYIHQQNKNTITIKTKE